MLRITLRQLEAFYLTATLGTVNAAARNLHLTQPAVTTRLKELEEELGSALFLRTNQGVELTPMGREVMRQTECVLAESRKLQELGKKTKPPLDGILRFGCDDSAAVVVSTILQRLKGRYPGLRVELSVEVSKTLNEKLTRRELDVALHSLPVGRPHVKDRLLGWVQTAWVGSATMPVVDTTIDPRMAASLPIITNPPNSVLHQVVKTWLGEGGEDLRRLNHCNSLSLLVNLVEQGHAIAALPMPIVHAQLGRSALKVIYSEPPLTPIEYYVSHLEEKEAKGALQVIEIAEAALMEAEFFVRLNS